MPLKDPRYEYVRSRSRKEKEKDHEKETRSSSGSGTTTIRDKKHRNSVTSNPTGSSDTASQPSAISYQDIVLEQLPPLPETEESESTSTGTSPIVRTNSTLSNINSRSSPSHIEVPAKWQPYLESVCDTASKITVAHPNTNSKEWIGPNPDIAAPTYPSDSLTPTPKPIDFVGSAGSVSNFQVPEQITKSIGLTDPESGEIDPTASKGEVSAIVYSWPAKDSGHEHCYQPSQMTNPFLPTSYATPSERNLATIRPKTDTPHESIRVAPKAPSPPLPVRRSPPPKVQRNQQPHHTPQMTSNMMPGYDYSMIPAMAPMPLHQTTSNPLPFSSGPPMVDHPAHLLHRIASVLPDIAALMNLYQNTCALLMARDSHIAHLQAQKAAEGQQQNARIKKLTEEITSVRDKNAAHVQSLSDEISDLKEKYSRLKESHSKEKRQKEDAREAHANLKTEHAEAAKKHQEKIHEMKQDFAHVKTDLIADHSARERGLMDQMQSDARIAKENLIARIAEMTRNFERDKQAQEERWLKHTQDIKDGHATTCRDLEHVICVKEKVLEEERRDYSRYRDCWDKEREAMTNRWDEERHQLKDNAEDQRQILAIRHQGEKDNVQRAMDAALSRHKSEAQDTIHKLQGKKEEYRQQMEATHAHYRSEIQGAAANLRKEKEEYGKATDAVLMQQKSELQDTIRQLQKEKEDLLRSRLPSQTHIAEAGESINKLEREMETSRAGAYSEKAKWIKPATESNCSRSSTPAPREDRNKLKRASGMYGSGTSLKSKGAIHEEASKANDGCRGQSRERNH